MKIKLILLLMLLLINPVSAKFICGEVVSIDDTTPSWYETKVYLKSNPTYQTTCKVSPANNRYCCDIDSLQDNFGYKWKVNDTFTVQITDKLSGYFASKKDIQITGEGYDISPNLTLEKAIKIIQPNTTLTISETTIQIQPSISPNCISTQNNISTTFGKNEITILATCNNEQFQLQKIFFIIQNITFQKDYPKKIKSGKTTIINLKVNLSHSIENINLKEYVPSSWQVQNISNNGTLSSSTPQYNVITWKVTGDNFSFNYETIPPQVGIWPEYFQFKTTIYEYTLSQNTIQVYKIFPIPFKPNQNTGGFVYNPKSFSKVSPELPLIFKEDKLTAALYSTIQKDQASFNLLNFLYEGSLDRNLDYIKSYQLQTTLNETERGKIVFEYKVNKSLLKEKDYKEIGFFEKNAGKFLKITGAAIGSSEDSIEYRFESDHAPSEIFILAEKNSISVWDRVLNFWDKIKFW